MAKNDVRTPDSDAGCWKIQGSDDLAGVGTQEDRRHLLERFQIVDVARKVVGVGTRAFIVLLHGRDEQDPLFLQPADQNRATQENSQHSVTKDGRGSTNRELLSALHWQLVVGRAPSSTPYPPRKPL